MESNIQVEPADLFHLNAYGIWAEQPNSSVFKSATAPETSGSTPMSHPEVSFLSVKSNAPFPLLSYMYQAQKQTPAMAEIYGPDRDSGSPMNSGLQSEEENIQRWCIADKALQEDWSQRSRYSAVENGCADSRKGRSRS